MTARRAVRSIAQTILRRSAGPLAAAMALLGTAGINSASADVSYTSYSWIGDNVHILTPDNVTGGAGQIQLHTTTGQTILAWCLDVFDYLQNTGIYSVSQNGSINNVSNPSYGAHIGGLMVEGNQYIQTKQSVIIGGYTYNYYDISAATQIAIWATEYGSNFSYDTKIMPNGSGFADLVAYVNSNAGTSTYFTLDPDPVNCTTSYNNCTHPTNQHLGYVPVPGPLAGAGLPGLVAACAALIALARRRRQAAT